MAFDQQKRESTPAESHSQVNVWLIQPAIAPYRIPLFHQIAKTPGVNLTVVVQAQQLAGHPWNIDLDKLPFRTLRVPSITWRTTFETEVFISPALIRAFFKEKPDVVICSGFTMSTILLFLPMLVSRTPYVIWNEGTVQTDDHASFLKMGVRRAISRQASGFLVAGSLSQSYVKSLLSKPEASNFYVAYNCIDNAQFMRNLSNDRDQAFARELKQKFAKRNLLYVGKLGERKGIKQLLEAYRRLVQERGMKDVGLILLGEGPLRQFVNRFAQTHELPHIFLEGFVSQDRIPTFYAAADVFTLLSLSDPNPLVIFEALAAGIPIVCSNRAGNAADFIVDGSNGYQVDPLEIDNIVDKLVLALTTIDRRTSSRLSRELVAKASYQDTSAVFVQSILATTQSNSAP